MLQLEIRDEISDAKTANKCLNIGKWIEVVGRSKDDPSLLYPCCPVNCQCQPKKTQIEQKINYCQIFAFQLHLHLMLWSCKVVVFWQKSKSSYRVCLLLMILHVSKKKLIKIYA